jgi:hypothetical protein
MKDSTFSDFLTMHYSHMQTGLFDLLINVSPKEGVIPAAQLKPLTAYAFDQESPSKGMCRAVTRLVTEWNHPDITALALCRVLSRATKPAINADALIQLINTQTQALPPVAATALRLKDITLLRRFMNDKRLLKLLWTTEIEQLMDTRDMMHRIHDAHPTLSYLPKKIKSIHQMHELCVRTLPKIHQSDFDLEQRPDILQLDNKIIKNDLVIRVPKRHFDLVDLGESLSFCIGNGTYSRKVKDKQCSIVAVFDKDKPLYGVQFTRYRILCAEGFGNQRDFAPPKDVLQQLQQLLTKAPELPSDFLPITDSGWVHGYRYNDEKNDLYLLLKESVYVYANVPRETYEALLEDDRKGTFVNREIKPHYECEFLGRLEDLDRAEVA